MLYQINRVKIKRCFDIPYTVIMSFLRVYTVVKKLPMNSLLSSVKTLQKYIEQNILSINCKQIKGA